MLLCVILMLFVTGTVNCGNTVEVNERFNRLETLVETLLEENEHLKTRIKELETSLDEIKEGIVVREGDETTNDEIDDADHKAYDDIEQKDSSSNTPGSITTTAKSTTKKETNQHLWKQIQRRTLYYL